ncbi:FkbM family methyltransferase [Streptomyces sp. NPDC050658]|uniref:FkbM family methyltransferase n=1 Tax=unclassified Streptomyces TaxID=2593676 RepID=UPI0034491A18
MSAATEQDEETRSAGVRQRALCAAVRAGRRAVHGTPLQGSGLTTSLSAALHRIAFPSRGKRVRVPYRGLWFTMADGERCTAAGLLSGRHEQLALDLFETFSAHASHVLDIGASIGLYACSGAAALPSSGRLTAFEPVPANLRALRRNLTLNECADRVRVEAVAVGAGPGQLTLHLSGVNSGGHTAGTAGHAPSGETVTVPRVDVDSYLIAQGLPAPDVMKIDVEGYEAHVLEGAAHTVARSGAALFVEYLPSQIRGCGSRPGDVLDALYEDGRRVYVIDEHCRQVRRAEAADLSRLPGGHPHAANLLSLARTDQERLLPESAQLSWECPAT